MTANIDPFTLLQDELNGDKYTAMITASTRVSIVANAMGPARVRSELIPFMVKFVANRNDEVNTHFARACGDMIDAVGGAANVLCLFTVLEPLFEEEESVVHSAAVEACVKIIKKMSKESVKGKVVPLVQKLAKETWFTARVSVCGLMAATAVHLDATAQGEFVALFNELATDETPMVRKAAYVAMPGMIAALPKSFIKSDFIGLITTLCNDEMYLLRQFTVPCVVAVAKRCQGTEFSADVLPLIESLSDDSSWRVRRDLCAALADLVAAGDCDSSRRTMVQCLARVLEDLESEVAIAATRALNPVGKACVKDDGGQALLVDEICPLLAQVCEARPNVRDVMAQELLSFSVYCGKEASIKHIVPLIKVLAKDEAFTVRNSIVKDLAVIAKVVTPSVLVESLLPALTQLAKDPKWRVRMGVIGNIGMMASTLGLKMFEKNFQPTLMAALADHVSAIRECACSQVGSLVKEFGAAWAGTDFFPAALAMYDQGTNYLHRVTCLLVIESAAQQLDAVSISTHLLPTLVMACTDDVANVRISAAKCALVVIKKLDAATVTSKLKPLLTKMIKDADGDVVHFSTLALKECK